MCFHIQNVSNFLLLWAKKKSLAFCLFFFSATEIKPILFFTELKGVKSRSQKTKVENVKTLSDKQCNQARK